MPEQIDMTAPDAEVMAWYELNDIGNAKRLRDLAGGHLLWCEDHWVAYDGTRWADRDGDLAAQRLAQDMARHVADEADAIAARIEAGKDRKGGPLTEEQKEGLAAREEALLKHAVLSGNVNKTSGALTQAKSDLAVSREDFDRDLMALNTPQGTLRFVQMAGGEWTVRLDPHDPVDRLSRITGAAWNPKAEASQWLAHIETVLPDADTRRFFQACAGYALTGEIREQCIFLLQGKGGDGKSTTMDVIREVMGGYGVVAGVESFLHGAVRSGADASPDMARLGGDTRLVSTGEPKIGAALDEARIKQVTGGQPITARELHGKPFEYRPRFKVFFECNRKPRISGDDDGIWRRIVVIQFPHQFKGKADKSISKALLAEAEGVLRWLVEGTLIWLNEGLNPPAAVQEAIDDYRRASNPFAEWFTERVDTTDAAARTPAKDLYDSYKAFCEENSVEDRGVMTSTAFGRALGDKQLMKAKGSDGRVFRRGCRLRGEADLVSSVSGSGSGSGDEWSPDGHF